MQGLGLVLLALLRTSAAHTWMSSRSRAVGQASLASEFALPLTQLRCPHVTMCRSLRSRLTQSLSKPVSTRLAESTMHRSVPAKASRFAGQARTITRSGLLLSGGVTNNGSSSEPTALQQRASRRADPQRTNSKEYYAMLQDYVDSAPLGANKAAESPRYHGAPHETRYCDNDFRCCAGGDCETDLFTRKLPTSDPACPSRSAADAAHCAPHTRRDRHQ